VQPLFFNTPFVLKRQGTANTMMIKNYYLIILLSNPTDMLLNDFYTLLDSQSDQGKINAKISFNKDHKIFAGHFPGHPVVPGVCMMQIVREVMEQSLSKRLNISIGNNLKFLSIIDPEKTTQVEVGVNYSSEGNDLKVNATLSDGPTTFFKFKGVLSPK
jgi:3-hydroxyacyl-[acyl-carrier-protein] dehydratase